MTFQRNSAFGHTLRQLHTRPSLTTTKTCTGLIDSPYFDLERPLARGKSLHTRRDKQRRESLLVPRRHCIPQRV
jgi:hypothetical protein